MYTLKEGVLLEALFSDQEKKNQLATNGETSDVLNEGNMLEKNDSVVPTGSSVDIPIGSSGPLRATSAASPLSQPDIASLPPPIAFMDTGLPLPPPPSAGIDAAVQLQHPPLLFRTSPGQRRKPWHGWVTDDDEEPQFIRLLASSDGSISPPVTPPSEHAKQEFF